MAYTVEGRVGKVRVRGARLQANLAASLLSGSSISLSTSGPMTMTLVFDDPELDLLAAGLFARGAAVDYAGLAMVVRAVDVGQGDAGPTVTVTCRSTGWVKLQKQIGARVWKKTRVSQVAIACAKRAGMKALVQASPKVRTVTRKKKTTKVTVKTVREKNESTVSMLQNYAGDLGYLLFERQGRLVYGTPRWIARQTVVRTVQYSRASGVIAGFGGPRALPELHRAEDSPRGVAELSGEFDGPDADGWRPGDVLRLRGVPTFSGSYLVNEVTIPLSDADPVQVSAAVPTGLKVADGDSPPPVEPSVAVRASGGSYVSAPAVADFVTPVQTLDAVPGPTDGEVFDGAELVEWAAARAGLMFGGTPAQMRARCVSKKTTRTVSRALKTRGALLFRAGQVAVVVGSGKAMVPVGRGYQRQSVTASQWTSAALVPGLKYPKGS